MYLSTFNNNNLEFKTACSRLWNALNDSETFICNDNNHNNMCMALCYPSLSRYLDY